jgi:hypothetical protein
MNPAPTSALEDRIRAWVREALTKAVVKPIPDVDRFSATVPGIRRAYGSAVTESAALIDLEASLRVYAGERLAAGDALPTFKAPAPPASTQILGLIRKSRLRRLLLDRAGEWGASRQLLPAGAIDAFCADLDQLITRHASAMANPQ